MKEYLVRLAVRDPDRPLSESMLLEFGVNVDNPKALVESLGALVDILKLLKTPEAVAQYMTQNATMANAKVLVGGK